MPIPQDLLSLAAKQRGVFLTTQAAALGVSAVALVRLVKEGAALHPARGLYVAAALAEPAHEARHRQLAAGALLLYPDAILDGVSAVLAHGLPVWGLPLDRPEIIRPIHRSAGVVGVRVRPDLGLPPVDTADGLALPADMAIVRMTIDHGILQGVVSADAAIHTARVRESTMLAAVERVASWPHSGRARSMLTLIDGRSESVGESILRVEAALRGIRLIPQVEVRDHWGELLGRSDFRVEGTKVLVEFDGKIKYAAGDPDVLWAEKRREDRLRDAGYVVVRVSWADLAHPERVMARIRRAVLRAAA